MAKQKLYRYDITDESANMISNALAILSPDTMMGRKLARELSNLFAYGRVPAGCNSSEPKQDCIRLIKGSDCIEQNAKSPCTACRVWAEWEKARTK